MMFLLFRRRYGSFLPAVYHYTRRPPYYQTAASRHIVSFFARYDFFGRNRLIAQPQDSLQ